MSKSQVSVFVALVCLTFGAILTGLFLNQNYTNMALGRIDVFPTALLIAGMILVTGSLVWLTD